ncbi:MAG: SDR family oxidoreductase [Cohaesibacteraceae bacterium]|nr:SDR family oxidoreductase [Cohaesibacteraceae bacterium]
MSFLNPPFSLEGETAFVTGASSGIGAHIAEVFARAGARVMLSARRLDRLETLRDKLKAEGLEADMVHLDVTDPDSIGTAFEYQQKLWGTAGIILNNSGIASLVAALDETDESWDHTIAVNLTGVRRIATVAAKAMVASGKSGSIINTASILGLRQAPGLTSYAVSKAGVIQLTKQLALEWAKHGIRVNAIAPGYFQTEINDGYFDTEGGQLLLKRIPMRRIGEMNELDGPALLLASQAGLYITGITIPIDGGHLLSTL